ncbi:hypothetical protein [Streptomyces showdoensis]|uniref:Uncharacterized protein n=1 Tax=Streptomyces showdoensis TaxID=68268 RepID=A0A2P2GP75_STREW|nr:hypothetical protein [Streptomyces showdoensis]KKZ73301.1 hypothetical protein VO63_13960 [Streptomyces showdoensis]
MAEIVLTNTGLAAFLEASPELRGPGSRRAADAVLSLLALRGADRATGVPEPTPGLVRRLLVEDLPAFVCAAPEELAAYPAVLRALARRFDGSGRAVEGVIGEAADDFERAMGDPGNLTWPRWYAQLLRADGTDPDDPAAVRAWLARLDGPPVPDGMRRADLMGRTAVADVLLAEALTRAYVRDARQAPPAGPLLTDHDVAQGIGTVAAALLDRWTAAGLAEGLAGDYAHLAPGPDAFPHLVLADALLDEHLDYYGDPAEPLPPPEQEAVPADPEADADLLAAAVEELADEGTYGGEAAHLLYTLYQRGCSAESVARRAAEFEDWPVDPALEDAPVRVPPPGSPAYTTPTAGELARLLGAPGITDADRTRLDGPAHELAAVVDRLAGTGLVFRRGDAFGLTPRGCAAVRYLLAVRGVAVPDAAETAAWDASTLVAAASGWPPAAAGRALGEWLRALEAPPGDGDEQAWTQLLGAVGRVNAGTSDAAATRGLLAVLDLAEAPAGALRHALADPVTGARAEAALRARGEDVDPRLVPPAARALAVLDGLPGKRGPLESRRTAFDAAAARWPGGSAALVAAMTAADPHETARVLGPLGIGPAGPVGRVSPP